jgi:sugar phosphate isomerase/epimerase
MDFNRREMLGAAGLGIGALSMLSLPSMAADKGPFSKPSKMKVGLVTYNLAKNMTNQEIIDVCTKAKIQGVELRSTHKHGVELSLSKKQRAEVKKLYADSAVELMGLGSAYDYHTPDQSKLRKDIEATKEYIVLAHDVGATGIKVRPNGIPKEVPKEKTLEQIGKSLREVGEFGADYGVAIRVEVHGRESSYLPNMKVMMDVADHKNVGICWNSNSSDLAGEGFDYNFNLVKDKIISCHMRDLYDENYPFRKLLTRLNEIGYTGYCLAELHHTSPDPLITLKYFRAMWLAYQGLL